MIALWTLTLLSGCGLGTLNHSDGREPLRSAWWREMPEQPDRTEIVLSNGYLPCEEADWRDETIRVDLVTSMCREGARHLWLQAVGPQSPWSGDGPTGSQLLASSYTVEEAQLNDADGLDRTYTVTRDDLVYSASEGGLLSADADEDVLIGEVSLPLLDTAARFRAEQCTSDAAYLAIAQVFAADGCP